MSAESSKFAPFESLGRETTTKSRPAAYATYLATICSTSFSPSPAAVIAAASAGVAPSIASTGSSVISKTSRTSKSFGSSGSATGRKKPRRPCIGSAANKSPSSAGAVAPPPSTNSAGPTGGSALASFGSVWILGAGTGARGATPAASAVCVAISSSSSVGTTKTLHEACGADTSATAPSTANALRVGSTATPNRPSRSAQIRILASASPSPIPPQNAIASTRPPSLTAYAPKYLRTRSTKTSRASCALASPASAAFLTARMSDATPDKPRSPDFLLSNASTAAAS
mmetsp:Transcript_25381/g.78287  ORF Transcript_25381/g.78287 Transcript_25381/m.78287 type:complete len:286 (-) Transcript_25381:559-1416(-)